MGGRFGEILVILILGLLFFGGDKLPSIGKALGSALNEFKKAVNPQPENQVPHPQNQPAMIAESSERGSGRTRRSAAKKGRSKSSR